MFAFAREGDGLGRAGLMAGVKAKHRGIQPLARTTTGPEGLSLGLLTRPWKGRSSTVVRTSLDGAKASRNTRRGRAGLQERVESGKVLVEEPAFRPASRQRIEGFRPRGELPTCVVSVTGSGSFMSARSIPRAGMTA